MHRSNERHQSAEKSFGCAKILFSRSPSLHTQRTILLLFHRVFYLIEKIISNRNNCILPLFQYQRCKVQNESHEFDAGIYWCIDFCLYRYRMHLHRIDITNSTIFMFVWNKFIAVTDLCARSKPIYSDYSHEYLDVESFCLFESKVRTRAIECKKWNRHFFDAIIAPVFIHERCNK